MNNYLEIIKEALVFFPFIALIISIPFILFQYHHFGSISKVKVLIIYSFVLYLICAYFLVILPLPSLEEVANLKTPRAQLIPFSFILDFINESGFDITNYKTYLNFLLRPSFYVPIYNIVLTIPFGFYLKYYLKKDLKNVILDSFLLSLFFELTQLTGLYFIYERGYRLFDVDDLILNTLGGIVGFILTKPLIKYLPKIEVINEKAREVGKKVSGLRRTTYFFLDLFLFIIFEVFIRILIKSKYAFIISLIIYYVLMPYILKGKTLGGKFLNLKIINNKEKNNIINIFFRVFFFVLTYFVIPLVLLIVAKNLSYMNIARSLRGIVWLISLGLIFLLYVISAIKFLFTNKKMLYEKLSKTELVSTIK